MFGERQPCFAKRVLKSLISFLSISEFVNVKSESLLCFLLLERTQLTNKSSYHYKTNFDLWLAVCEFATCESVETGSGVSGVGIR